MSTTTILNSLRTLFDFEAEPVLQDDTTVWSACLREDVSLSEHTLIELVEALFPDWPCDSEEPWIFYTSSQDLALLRLNPEDGSIELQFHDSVEAHEDAVSLL